MFAGSELQFWGGIVYTSLIALAAINDVRTRRIPNRVVVWLAALGFLFSLLVFGPAGGAVRSTLGLLVGFACWLPFYVLRWLGAGDVKLFASAGTWLGAMRTFEGALLAALAGAVLALGWMLWTYGVRRTASTLTVATSVPSVLLPDADARRRSRALPYGVALAAGALAAGWLPRSLLFQ